MITISVYSFCRQVVVKATVCSAMIIALWTGKPMRHSTFSRKQLKSWVNTKRGGLLQQWVYRSCVISGTRLLLYKGKTAICAIASFFNMRYLRQFHAQRNS